MTSVLVISRDSKLRSELERAALALVRTRYLTTHDPVILSLRLECVGRDPFSDYRLPHPSQYKISIQMTGD